MNINPVPADAQVIIVTEDPEVLSEIGMHLMTLKSEGVIHCFLDIPEETVDISESSVFLAQSRAQPHCHRFLLWGESREQALKAFFKKLQTEFGNQ